jgi:hypothetical protein
LESIEASSLYKENQRSENPEGNACINGEISTKSRVSQHTTHELDEMEGCQNKTNRGRKHTK